MNNESNKSSNQSYYGAVAQEITDRDSQEIVNILYRESTLRNLDGKYKPLSYYEYIQYEHRLKYKDNIDNIFRIGDCCFEIPPEYISITSINDSESLDEDRLSNIEQSKKQNIRKEIFVDLMINGINQVNGYQVESPFDFKYYVDGLRNLICQFKYTPFVPIECKVVNDANNINNVALKSMSVETVEGFSESLRVKIIMEEFNVKPYFNRNDVSLDNHIDWDLYRFYTQKNLKNSNLSNLKKIKSVNFTGKFKFKKLHLKNIDFSKIKSKTTIMDEIYFDEILSNEENVYLTYINFNLNNIFSNIKLNNGETPTKQYMGFNKIDFIFEFKTSDESIIKKFNKLNSKNTDIIKVENELVNLTGTEYMTIKDVQIDTVFGFPGLYNITIKCRSYDIDKIQKMKPIGFRPFNEIKETYEYNEIPEGRLGTEEDFIDYTSKGIDNKTMQDVCANNKLMYLEMYPNLSLPKYDEIDNAIQKIRDFRFKNGVKQTSLIKYPRTDIVMYEIGGNEKYNGFVEPDFYIIYPVKFECNKINTQLEAIKPDIVVEPEYKYGYEPQSISTLGNEFKEELFCNEHLIFKNENFNKIHGNDIGTFNIKRVKPKQSFKELPENNPNTVVENMLIDEFLYSQKGTLIKAFPNFIFMLCDEATDCFDGQKSWTNYYIYKSVMEIKVSQDVDSPISSAKIVISNSSNEKNLDDNSVCAKNDTLNIFNKNQFVTAEFLKGYKEESKYEINLKIVEDRNKLDSQEVLKEGTRVHIRMGYGSNPSKYPIVFNGTIVEINILKDTILIEAKSDGLELTDKYLDEKMNFLGDNIDLKKDASNIILDLISKRNFKTKYQNIEYNEKNFKSRYGVEHFGMYDFNSIETYGAIQSDISKNIYLSNYKGIYLDDIQSIDYISESIYEFLPIGKKIWDICKMSEKSMPEFVVYPRPFLFEHRLFFGLPVWMYKFNTNKIKSDVYEYSKAFSQMHIVDFYDSIINNNIIIDNNNLLTNARGIYNVLGNLESTPFIISDCNIKWSNQKLKVLDNSRIQNFNIFSNLEDENLKYRELYANNRHMSIRNCISEIQNSWKEAYDGDLIITGKPQVNVYDLIAINDLLGEVSGVCLAKKVTHSLNMKTGFTTSVTPGLLTANSLKYSGMSNVLKSCNKILFSISNILNNERLVNSDNTTNISKLTRLDNYETLNNMLTAQYEMFNYKNSIIIYPLYKNSYMKLNLK
ncbi:hypothetical protein IR152_01025 [Clostridioides sp. ES-S-0108-01]|uniref:hypothetical protein n=1 Tax=Clostridioides sp. ES-S-0108-01 TaxID=2770773 RepID=UPI001D0C0C26|nr:hypothetical protein [Clostridioides sp. ES-S-0108-01]UDN49960.1 hypothetical protein JJC16_11315 [Clostridioides sp. ES-S-0107-01]